MTPIKAIENIIRYAFIGNIDPIQDILLLQFSNSGSTYKLLIQDNIFNIIAWLIIILSAILSIYYLLELLITFVRNKKK